MSVSNRTAYCLLAGHTFHYFTVLASIRDLLDRRSSTLHEMGRVRTLNRRMDEGRNSQTLSRFYIAISNLSGTTRAY